MIQLNKISWFFLLLCIYVLKGFVYIYKLCFRLLNHKIKDTHKILILSYFNLGDLVCDTPSLKAIKLAYPKSEIHLLVRREAGVFMMENYWFIDSAQVITSELDSNITYIQLIMQLAKTDFDISFQLVRPFKQIRKTYIPFILGIKDRYGIIDKREAKYFNKCFTKYCYTGNKRSRREEAIEIVETAGIPVLNKDTEIWQINKEYTNLTVRIPFISKSEFIVVHPGASIMDKCWPKEKYIDLINQIKKNYDYEIIVTGTKSEIEILEFIEQNINYTINIYDNLSLGELFSLLSHTNNKLLITNDTGPLHFSMAQKKNIISIFGPTIPDYAIGTDLPSNLVVLRGTTRACSKDCNIMKNAMYDRKNIIKQYCNNEHTVCMDMIPVELVFFFAKQFLDGKKSIIPTNNIQGYNPFI